MLFPGVGTLGAVAVSALTGAGTSTIAHIIGPNIPAGTYEQYVVVTVERYYCPASEENGGHVWRITTRNTYYIDKVIGIGHQWVCVGESCSERWSDTGSGGYNMRGEKDQVCCNHRICSQETKLRYFLRLYKPCCYWSQKGMSSFIRSCTCCGQQIAPAPRVMTAIGFLHAVLYISLCCALVVLMRSGTV